MTRRSVLIAPDSFKGTATATEVATALAEGWASVRPEDNVRCAPMADGGEGTLEAFEASSLGAIRMPVTVRGPADTAVETYWLLLADGTAVVELASTSGLGLVDELRPLDAHTYGFGEAIRAAITAGATRLLLTVGGSASTDCGTGALSALGARFTNSTGAPVALGGRHLSDISAVDLSELPPVPVGGALILSDVTNPLLGQQGAAAIFSPQKGATPEQVVSLAAGLEHFSALLDADPTAAGTGAAGGCSFGLLAWGATLSAGSVAVAEVVGLAEAIRAADVVITGEGRFDSQSAAGKVVSHVLNLTSPTGTPTLLVAGLIDADPAAFAGHRSLSDLAGSSAAAMEHTLHYLRRAGAELAVEYSN
ncbi:MAG TPA: glycerate kinase [Glaciihabitans sp.]|nr:glycerate kinase [Glaciihabitans sp.]